MRNFIERVKDYFTRKDCADMAICTWKSANEEVYADFCKRMDAIGKGNLSILMDIYQMMRECTPPEALLLYNWLSDFMNGKDIQNIANQQWAGKYTDIYSPMYHQQTVVDRCQRKNGYGRVAHIPKVGIIDGSFRNTY